MKKTASISSNIPSISSEPESSSFSWPQRLSIWVRLKKLQFELWSSGKFQKECEDLECFTMADLEKQYRAEIQEKIQQLKKK